MGNSFGGEHLIRATTPTYILTLPQSADIDLTTQEAVYFTINQAQNTITKEVTPTDAKTVEVTLTQEETWSFKDGSAEIQLNWIDADGKRGATYVQTVRVDKQLLNEVL